MQFSKKSEQREIVSFIAYYEYWLQIFPWNCYSNVFLYTSLHSNEQTVVQIDTDRFLLILGVYKYTLIKLFLRTEKTSLFTDIIFLHNIYRITLNAHS